MTRITWTLVWTVLQELLLDNGLLGLRVFDSLA